MTRACEPGRAGHARRALVALVVAALALPARSRGAEPGEAAALVEAHCRARAETTTLRARFVQTKVFAELGEEDRASGVLSYRRPRQLRWDYEQPDRSWTVLDGTRGWAVFPGTKQVQRFELGPGRADAILSIVGFGACGPDFARSFEFTVRHGGGAPVLILKPRRPELAASLRSIELTLDPGDHLPRRVLLQEITGDHVSIELQDVRIGVKLASSIFDFTTPEGYSVSPRSSTVAPSNAE